MIELWIFSKAVVGISPGRSHRSTQKLHVTCASIDPLCEVYDPDTMPALRCQGLCGNLRVCVDSLIKRAGKDQQLKHLVTQMHKQHIQQCFKHLEAKYNKGPN